jgi:hypothetical protein
MTSGRRAAALCGDSLVPASLAAGQRRRSSGLHPRDPPTAHALRSPCPKHQPHARTSSQQHHHTAVANTFCIWPTVRHQTRRRPRHPLPHGSRALDNRKSIKWCRALGSVAGFQGVLLRAFPHAEPQTGCGAGCLRSRWHDHFHSEGDRLTEPDIRPGRDPRGAANFGILETTGKRTTGQQARNTLADHGLARHLARDRGIGGNPAWASRAADWGIAVEPITDSVLPSGRFPQDSGIRCVATVPASPLGGRNGARQPQQSPHLQEYAGYTWHGRYNGLTDGSKSRLPG